MKIAAVIPTLRERRDVLRDTLEGLAEQTRRPDVVVVPTPDVDAITAGLDCTLPTAIIRAPRGAASQRNAAIHYLDDGIDLVVFLDDDVVLDPTYIEVMKHLFLTFPDVVLATGKVLVDGVKFGGLSRERATAIVMQYNAGHQSSADEWELTDAREAYGCNMVGRRSVSRQVCFDENLPLYSWLEDLDFARRCALHGRVVRCGNARMVHLGHPSGGRRSDRIFGFSQVINPYYLWKKGTIDSFAELVVVYWRPIIKNVLWSIASKERVGRRQRLLGNLHAFRALAAGNADPNRARTLHNAPR